MSVFVIAAVCVSYFMPPRHVSTTGILIEPNRLQTTVGTFTSADLEPAAETTIVEAQIALMTSDDVLREVIDRENLKSDEEFGASRGLLFSMFQIVGLHASPALPQTRALQTLRGAVDAELTAQKNVVEISVVSRDPVKSTRIAKAIALAYVKLKTERLADARTESAVLVAKRRDELRQGVAEADALVARFRADNNLPDGTVAAVADPGLAIPNAELVEAKIAASQARVRHQVIRDLVASEASPDAIADALQSDTISQLRTRYASAFQRERRLVLRLKDSHPDLRDVRDDLRSFEAQIDAEISRLSDAALREQHRTQSAYVALQEQFSNRQDTAVSGRQHNLKLAELVKDAEAKQQSYEAYLVKSRAFDGQRTNGSAFATIVAPAVYAQNLGGVSLALILILAIAAGGGLGGVLGLVRDTLDQKVYDLEQFHAATGLAVLADVPRLPDGSNLRGGAEALDNEGEIYLSAFVIEHPSSKASHAIGHVWACISGEAGSRVGPRALLVTTSGQGEGKSTVSLNLALAAGAAGQNVLLVDADLAARHLTNSLCEDTQSGLVEVLRGASSLSDDDVLLDLGPRLTLLPAGIAGGFLDAPVTPLDIKRQIVYAGFEFDLIVFDGGVVFGDATTRQLAEIADTILTVSCRGRSTYEDLNTMLEGLAQNAGKTRGMVVTTA